MPLDLDQFKPPTGKFQEFEPSRPGTPPPLSPDDPVVSQQTKESSHWERWKQQYKGARLAPAYEFPRPFYSVPWTAPSRRGETAQQMPNYSQLTPSERSIYEWLPGFSESTVGQALQKFGEGPFGKALQVLDVGAEFAERAAGLASQAWKAKDDPLEWQDFTRDLSAAWYAGGLAADMTNLPTFSYNNDGTVNNFSLPTDLPGAAGIAQARKSIIDLVQQGATYSEALQEVKSGYYDSLGALQMRAQLYDLYSHVLLDPLNIVMPYIKPIERLRVASEFASTTKWADDVLEAARETVRISDSMDEILEVAQSTQKLTGRTATAFKKAQDAGDIEKAAQITNKLLDDVGVTNFERFSLYITGKQDPLKPNKFLDKIKFGGLTPEARASELMTTVQDNVGSYILARSDDPYQIANDINRAASGAVGPEMGHAFVTREGRAVQGLLKGFDVESQKLIDAYDLIKNERLLLSTIADELGVTEEKLMGLLAGGDFAGVSRMAKNALDPQQLEALYNTLKEMPYSANMFKYKLMNGLADHSSRQAVLMFGVKQRGFMQKLTAAVKSAETLVFLRINPGYMIRNVLNNELTIIGRGMGVNMDDLQKIVKEVIGFEPPRMSQGFGAIGDALGAPADVGSKVIADAARGERGFLDKATDAINRFKPFGKMDMGYISSKAEQAASRRAFATGYLQGWNRYFWKPGKGFDAATDYFPAQVQDMINTVDRGLMPAVEQAIGSAKNPQQVEDVFRGNLNLSMRSIMDDASAKLGYKVDEALPDEFIAKMETGLQDAARNGTVREYMTGVRQELQTHLDELAKDTVKFIRDDTAARIVAEGPAAFPKIWADQMDEWHGAAIQHAMESEMIAQAIRMQTDPEIIHQMWRAAESASDKFYTRLWDRWDGTVQGMVKGAKSEGIGISDDVVTNFKELKRGWRGWWKQKRKLNNDFWEAKRAGKTPLRSYEDIQAEISKTYEEMVQTEDTLTKTIDQLVAQGLEDEAMRKNFLSWRGFANQLRNQDKEEVIAFFERIKGMSAEQRAVEFEEFWRRRIARYEQMRGVEHMGESAMMGDAESVQRVQRAAAEVPPKDLSVHPDYIKVSRADLPDEVSDAMEIEAASLKNWLEGVGVERIAGEEPGTFLRASGNPEWYLELYRQGYTRKQVVRSLERILENKGKDIPRANEKVLPAVKDMIMERLIGGEEMPPHPATLLFFNMEDEAAEAIGQYLADPAWAKTATDEDWINLVGSEENLDRLFARLDEINEGLPPREELARLDLEMAEELGGLPPVEKAYIPSKDKLAPKPLPYAVAEDTYWFTRGNQALDGIERSAIDQAAKPALKWDNLPKEAKEAMEGYLKHVQGQMSDARYASTRFAEYKRDTALLNYNRRYKFDTYATMMFPYQFWFTHSAANWLIHSVDRPAMLSTFLKIKEFMNTAGSPNQALPTRLKGAMRVGVPFLPDWMEDSIYFDPLRSLLPFDTFAYPFERLMQNNSTMEGRTEFILNDMLENGQITQEELDIALAERDGPLWLKAKEMALADDDGLKFSAWDFASLISAPHAPLVWAYNVARGTPEDIGAFTPMSRTIKGAAGLMGVDWDRSPLNLEARLRKSLGLPAFDKWDDYRVDRMLSNMVARNEITIDEALRAMIEREGDAYNEAIKKANFEFGIGAMGSTLGIPAKAYPEGEYLQRSLVDDYQRAWAEAEQSGDYDAVNNFNQLHPEYEARLALWKSPEERMREFLKDEIWDIWNGLPSLTKTELKEQLGDNFAEKFIDKDTRSYDSINLDEMQIWLKLMGGDPPGTLNSEPVPIDLADPEVAWRVQVYRDTRNAYFPEELWDIQDKYYDIPEKDWKARKAYREKNPMLPAYWDWRRDWMHRNPETVPYLTEKDYEFEYSSPEAERRAEQPQPWLTWDEWSQYMGPNMTGLMEDHFLRDYELPGVLQDRVEQLAAQLGISYSEAMSLMEESVSLR